VPILAICYVGLYWLTQIFSKFEMPNAPASPAGLVVLLAKIPLQSAVVFLLLILAAFVIYQPARAFFLKADDIGDEVRMGTSTQEQQNVAAIEYIE